MSEDDIRAMLGDENAMTMLAAYLDPLAAPDPMQRRRLETLCAEVVFGEVDAYEPGAVDKKSEEE